MKRHPDELYVGYQRRAPRGLTRFLRPRLGLILLVALGLAAMIAGLQRRFEPGTFEFQSYREFEGVVLAEPYPVLRIEHPGTAAGAAASDYQLVAFGKHGARDEVAGFDRRRVRLEGSLIYRGDQTMIEIVSGTVRPAKGPEAEPPGFEDLGERTLVGEIVDSKCYLGVMKPGRERTHRACAALCIRGGVPPMLVSETASGERRHLLLVDRDGAPVNDRVLDLVAEPVEITGRVTRRGTLFYLAADPTSIRRLES